MSRKRSARKLENVLKDVVDSLGIEGKLGEGRVVAAWQDIAGERIGREVEKVYVKGGKLVVRVKTPVWRQELHLNRESWRRRLNGELGFDAVDEIVFR